MPTKKITTTIVEKFDYHDHGINIEPALLLKLLEFAHGESQSEEQLYSIVAKTQLLAETTPILECDHYEQLVSPIKALNSSSTNVENLVEMPKEDYNKMDVMVTPTSNPPA